MVVIRLCQLDLYLDKPSKGCTVCCQYDSGLPSMDTVHTEFSKKTGWV